MKVKLPRVMFAAPESGAGKTTVTCAVLKALLESGSRVAAFKCGPDYIDPMFHTEVVGAPSRNLDLFMLSEDICRYLLAKNSNNTDIALIEGVMGYYDGISGKCVDAGSYDLARRTKTPVILIVGCKGAHLSTAALVKGFAEFRSDSNIQGIILNNVSSPLYPSYKKAIEGETGIPVIGFMPMIEKCRLESRHLGLVTAAELSDLQEKISRLAMQAMESIDMDQLREIADKAPELEYDEPLIKKVADVRVAVARDKAFCFYYSDALDLLEEMGAKIIPFSPLSDTGLPACDGVILGGGYPELYAGELSANKSMLESVRKAVGDGLPCMAECGGFMYLFDAVKVNDTEGKTVEYPMAGVISGTAFITKKLTRFGYVTLTAQKDNLLGGKYGQINAHEFHYSDSTSNGEDYTATKPDGREWKCVHASETLFAGYPHIHLWGNRSFAENYIKKCAE